MPALPQCDATYPVFDQNGAPAADTLVTVKKVVDANGNSLLLGPLAVFTDSSGVLHVTLPQGSTAYLSARASGLWNCNGGVPFAVPAAASGDLVPLSAPPGTFVVVPPLTLSSDVLAIQKASASQDGYLSAADFARFDAATAPQGVTSFNAREGDVVSQAGDYSAFFLSHSGGTLTGPLVLPDNPTPAALDAVTRNYVDGKFASGIPGVATFNGRTGAVLPDNALDYSVFSSSAKGMAPAAPAPSGKFLRDDATWAMVSSRFPGTVWLTDYNASGSINRYAGSITSGTTTLTLTGSHDFIINQGILVKGAGSSGGNLLTKVVAVSGTQITLQDAASTGIGAITNNVQHDDTVALQTAVDDAFAAGGQTIFCPPGFYRLNGPFTDINSIIKVPFNINYPPGSALPTVAIGLIGYNQPFPGYGAPGPTTGVVFQTDKVGTDTNSCMIACAAWDPSESVTTCSNITIYCKDITWRTYDNPNISGVDMGMCGNAIFENVVVDTGLGNVSMTTQPSHGTFGLRTPRVSTGMAMDAFDHVYVLGYGIGIIFAEQFRSDWFSVMRCNIGMQAAFSYHPAWGIGLISECPTGIVFTDRQSVDFSLDIQPGAPGNWYSPLPGRDLVDSTNKCTGVIKYARVEGMTGNRGVVSVTGMLNCSLVSLDGLASSIRGGTTTIDSVSIKGLTIVNSLEMFDGSVNQLVLIGAADSADPGFRALEIANSGADITPPVISSVSASAGSTGATITWTTNETADSQVEYGTTTGYGSLTTLDPTLVLLHSVSLTGLTASTGYHYRVKSKDAAGNLATSSDFTFTTSAAPSTERAELWNGGAGKEYAALSTGIKSGLVSYWDCNDATAAVATDSQGTNVLSDSGSVPSVVGQLNQAFHFTGAGSQCKASSTSTGLSPGNTSFTLACWVSLDDLTADQHIITKSNGGSDEYILQFTHTGSLDRLQFTIRHLSSYVSVTANNFGLPTAGSWMFVVAWFNQSTNTLNIQVNNGTPDTQSISAGGVDANAAPFFFGSYSGSVFARCRLDAAGYWSRLLT